jgi:L-fucose isomerase-like protein
MAKLGVVLSDWMEGERLDATAIQCWTSVQQNSAATSAPDEHDERALPAERVRGRRHRHPHHVRHAARVGLAERAGGLEQQLRRRPDKCVLFHCGNWAKSFLPDIKIANAPILGTLGVENTYGALEGRTPPGPLTYGRLTTADAEGVIRATSAKASSPTIRSTPSEPGPSPTCRVSRTAANTSAVKVSNTMS